MLIIFFSTFSLSSRLPNLLQCVFASASMHSYIFAAPYSLALTAGGTQYAAAPAAVYFNGGSYTVEAWVYTIGYPSWSRLYDFGNGAANNNVGGAITQGPACCLLPDTQRHLILSIVLLVFTIPRAIIKLLM